MPKHRIRLHEAVDMFTCGWCHELQTTKEEISKFLSTAKDEDVLDEAFHCLKDHACPKAPPAKPRLASIRTRCFRCGEGIREGLPYMLVHLRHNYPDGRVEDSPREFHHSCFERFLTLGKSSRSRVTYQILAQESL
jgi:hypothetical protein